MTRLDPRTAIALVELANVDKELMLFDAETESEDLALRYDVFDTLAEAEPAWRALEAHAVFTPYQRFDWVSALLAARPLGKERLAIVVVKDGDRVVALLPLVVRSGLFARTARIVGWDVGNGDWLGIDPVFAKKLDRPALDRMLADIARLTGADLLALHSQPESWNGLANPLLALPHQPAPDHFYAGSLGTGHLNAKRIRNIERGRRRLEEAIGPVRLERADTPEAIEAVHAEFLRQRGIRFHEMGLANIFAEDWWQRFFKSAARNGIGSHRPVMAVHALYAGDQIIATSWGSCSGDHYSQYMNSTTDGPAAKYSLMGILLFLLVEELKNESIASIDMGLGDFEYKLDWTERQTVHDSVVALSPAGAIAGAMLQGLRAAKRGIKQNPVLWGIVTRVRAVFNHRA